jgi:hypothetical protein
MIHTTAKKIGIAATANTPTCPMTWRAAAPVCAAAEALCEVDDGVVELCNDVLEALEDRAEAKLVAVWLVVALVVDATAHALSLVAVPAVLVVGSAVTLVIV